MRRISAEIARSSGRADPPLTDGNNHQSVSIDLCRVPWNAAQMRVSPFRDVRGAIPFRTARRISTTLNGGASDDARAAIAFDLLNPLMRR
ncbi:hypothetical protein [Aureimonas frigidaquae]|uniref:hypothetical protein n=1 Tax=Aureimonas frigidaquae TaxID=424757 RepID=UPI000A7BA7C7|nr:hypothetical protein [Aureimonas frigidaquae]